MTTTSAIPRVSVPSPRIGYAPQFPEEWFRQQQRKEPGIARARETIDSLTRDAGLLPVEESPAEVVKARTAFDAAVSLARETIAEAVRAANATTAAAESDVVGATDALRQGKSESAPALTRPKAEALEEAALVRLAAVERWVAETHRALTDTARDHWQRWKADIFAKGDEVHAEALDALQRAQSAFASRASIYNAALVLDQQLSSRYPELPASREISVHSPNRMSSNTSETEAFATLEERLQAPIAWRDWPSVTSGSVVFVNPASGAPVRVDADSYQARVLRIAGWLVEGEDPLAGAEEEEEAAEHD